MKIKAHNIYLGLSTGSSIWRTDNQAPLTIRWKIKNIISHCDSANTGLRSFFFFFFSVRRCLNWIFDVGAGDALLKKQRCWFLLHEKLLFELKYLWTYVKMVEDSFALCSINTDMVCAILIRCDNQLKSKNKAKFIDRVLHYQSFGHSKTMNPPY